MAMNFPYTKCTMFTVTKLLQAARAAVPSGSNLSDELDALAERTANLERELAANEYGIDGMSR